MKKFIISLGVLAVATLTSVAQLGPNVMTVTTTGAQTLPLITNACKVKYVMVSSAAAGLVQFYDNSGTNTLGGTNYVTSLYTNLVSYATNTVTTNYIGTTGYTNFYTNTGIWTVGVAVPAATNALNPALAFATVAGVMGGYPTDTIFNRGVVVRTSTNTSVVVYYANP